MAPLPRSRILLLISVILLSQFGLAWLFGIPVNPLSLPEPLRSLLLLIILSAFVHFIVKPIALDYTISPDLNSLKRHQADWISSNIQFLSFLLLWCAVGVRKEVLPNGSKVGISDPSLYLLLSISIGMVILFALNVVYGDTKPRQPATEAGSEELALLEIQPKGKEDSAV